MVLCLIYILHKMPNAVYQKQLFKHSLASGESSLSLACTQAVCTDLLRKHACIFVVCMIFGIKRTLIL